MMRVFRRDTRGQAAVQFAMIAPALLVLMLGLGELAYQAYVQSVLTGAVQKAARDATIQGNAQQTAALDAIVQQQVTTVAAKATFVSTRTNFDSYASVAGEPFTDSKYPTGASGVYDGVCNHGETYVDVNANGRYDLDLSASGEGGANDISRYTMTVTYPRILPLGKLMTWGSTVTISATTILRNQPYATQTVNNGTTTGTCA